MLTSMQELAGLPRKDRDAAVMLQHVINDHMNLLRSFADTRGRIASAIHEVIPSDLDQPFWSIAKGQLYGRVASPVIDTVRNWSRQFGNGQFTVTDYGDEFEVGVRITIAGHDFELYGLIEPSEAVEAFGRECLEWTSREIS